MYKLALVPLLLSGLVAKTQTSPAARPPLDLRVIRPPQESGSSFAASESDLDQVIEWLHGHGFQAEPFCAGCHSGNCPAGAQSSSVVERSHKFQLAFHRQIHAYKVN